MSLRSRVREWAESILNVRIFSVLPHGVDLFADLRRLIPSYTPSVVLDIGANVGQSVHEVRDAYPYSEIWCLEPSSKYFTQLESKFRDDPKVRCFRLAAGDFNGIASMTTDAQSTMNRVVLDSGADPAQELEQVQACTIDSFCDQHQLRKVNLMKVDVEGHDLHVLRGAREFLRDHLADVLVVEAGMSVPPDTQVPFAALHKEISQHGYLPFGVYEQVHEWKRAQPSLRRINIAYLSRELAYRSLSQNSCT